MPISRLWPIVNVMHYLHDFLNPEISMSIRLVWLFLTWNREQQDGPKVQQARRLCELSSTVRFKQLSLLFQFPLPPSPGLSTRKSEHHLQFHLLWSIDSNHLFIRIYLPSSIFLLISREITAVHSSNTRCVGRHSIQSPVHMFGISVCLYMPCLFRRSLDTWYHHRSLIMAIPYVFTSSNASFDTNDSLSRIHGDGQSRSSWSWFRFSVTRKCSFCYNSCMDDPSYICYTMGVFMNMGFFMNGFSSTQRVMVQ